MTLVPEELGSQVALGSRGAHGSRVERYFTTPGWSPEGAVTWERRDARIVDFRTGEPAFEQLGVEVPQGWSQNATNIVAQKYFRVIDGEREHSVRQMVRRVCEAITRWGRRDGYFADSEEERAFHDELFFLLVNQMAAFNSPVWFNIGVPGARQQAAACFILDVADDMGSILNWYAEEGIIFKGGSGAGVNLSRLRSSREGLSGGGSPSGPVSFMRGADASAGTIKSGGTTRRAAKMVVLNADHPDIVDFVECKVREERKARALRAAGFDVDLDGADSYSLQYQNANNSVRLTDEFLDAVENDRPWALRAVTTGEVVEELPARVLFRRIAAAAWECADPGLQFDTTINRWNTTPNSGRIDASNPCFPGDQLVHTDLGLVTFRELLGDVSVGGSAGVFTHDVTSETQPRERLAITTPSAVMVTGIREVVRLRWSDGSELRCTPNHRIFTSNRGWVEAADLGPLDRIRHAGLATPAIRAERSLPEPVVEGGDPTILVPEKWSEELAHLLGGISAGGSDLRTSPTLLSYPSARVAEDLTPVHARVIAEFVDPDRPGAGQLGRTGGGVDVVVPSERVRAWIETLLDPAGSRPAIPASVRRAPVEAQSAYVRGWCDLVGRVELEGLDAAVVVPGPIEDLRGLQLLLQALEVTATVTEVVSARGELRVTGGDLPRFAAAVGFSRPDLHRQLGHALRRVADAVPSVPEVHLLERVHEGLELTFDLTEERNHSFIVNGVVVHNCSEHMRLANSACNLASINLMSFLGESGGFDVEAFVHATRVITTAQDILVGASTYPTEAITLAARASRDIGIGYTNLGASLMAMGLPYDSEQGRAWAATITGILTGAAAVRSTELAERLGPAPLFHDNAEPWTDVYRMHAAAAAGVPTVIAQPTLNAALIALWDRAVEQIVRVGARNAELSVAAPTGTISFLMDADTTGIEPDLSLVKTKKLVGGGTMRIVNQTVPRALRRLGYDPNESDRIIRHVEANGSVLGAPDLRAEHLPVFACAIGDNVISWRGHLAMMGAVQPFLSGAISKTVNVPESTTIDDIEELHLEAWRLGIKAVAVYRDNCKVGQPLSAGNGSPTAAPTATDGSDPAAVVERIVERVVHRPVRERLPRSRRSRTLEFRVADCKGFVTVGEYEDGRPGELFIRVSKQGSTLAGIMDAFAIAVSHGLQYGVPLRAFCQAFVGMRFEPAGMTDDAEVRIAQSLIDYLFRKLAIEYLSYEERSEMGIFSVSERTQPTLPGVEEAAVVTTQGLDITPDPPSADRTAPDSALSPPDAATPTTADPPGHPLVLTLPGATPGSTHTTVADRHAPLCMQCGVQMLRAGSCYVCDECGSTSGCS